MSPNKPCSKAALSGQADDKRSAYEPPTIIWEESFDKEATLAVACGKTNPAQGEPCAAVPGGS